MRSVIAYHLILSCYGFWLPNDPHGSWSEFVRAWDLRRFGPATTVRTRRSHARDPHDVDRRRDAKKELARSQVLLSGLQARAVANGFSRFVHRSGVSVHACAILRDHVHLVVARHHYSIEEIARHFKADATTQLKREGLHPFADNPYRDGTLPSPWVRNFWKCFIFDDDYVRRAITYTNNNPLRDGLKSQSWTFVTPFETPPLSVE